MSLRGGECKAGDGNATAPVAPHQRAASARRISARITARGIARIIVARAGQPELTGSCREVHVHTGG